MTRLFACGLLSLMLSVQASAEIEDPSTATRLNMSKLAARAMEKAIAGQLRADRMLVEPDRPLPSAEARRLLAAETDQPLMDIDSSACVEFNAMLQGIVLPYAGTGSTVGAPDVVGSAAGDAGFAFSLDAATGLNFDACLLGTDYDVDSYLYLGDPCDGGTLVWYDDGDPSCTAWPWASGWTIGALAPGDYTLVLSGFDMDDGNFDFSLTPSEPLCPPFACAGGYETEPNDGPNGNPVFYDTVHCGETVCGSVWAQAGTRDTDWFTLNLPADDSVRVALDVDQFDGVLMLMDAANTILYATDDNGWCGDEVLVTGCLPAGVYRVFVAHDGFTGVPATSYGLTVLCYGCDWIDPADVVAIDCDQELYGDTTGDPDYAGNGSPDNCFRFVNTVPNRVATFSLCFGTTWDTYLAVYARDPRNHPFDQPLAFDSNFCGLQSQVTMTLDVDDYWILVEGESASDAGEYFLNMFCPECPPVVCAGDEESEPNGDPWLPHPQVDPIDCGGTVCGSTWALRGTRDTDWYRLDLHEPDSLAIHLDAEAFDGVVLLFDQDQNFLGGVDDTGFCEPETLHAGCLDPGSYYIFVASTSFFGVNPTDYALSVVCHPCTPETGCDGETAGVVGPGGQVTTVAFRNISPPNTIATFSLCLSAPVWNSLLRVYDRWPTLPGALQLGMDDDACGPLGHAEATCVLPGPGLYYVTIEGVGGSDGGPFNLYATCESCEPLSCTGTPESEPNDGPDGWPPPTYDSIACGQTICGTVYKDGESLAWDADWYRIDLPGSSFISATLETGLFGGSLRLYDADASTLLQSVDVSHCETVNLETPCLQDGHYYLRVGVDSILQPYRVADYRLSLDCSTCDFDDFHSPCVGPHVNTDPWIAGASELAVGIPPTDYLRAERFGNAGSIVAMDCRGLQLYNGGSGWTTCAENPVLQIVFYDRYLAPAASYTTPPLVGVPVPPASYYGGFPAYDYNYVLATPLYLESGYVSIQGVADNSCWFFWLSAGGTDNSSLFSVNGGAWTADPFDLNYCLTLASPCAVPPVLGVPSLNPSGDVLLTWAPVPGAISYNIYAAPNGFGPWALIGNTTTQPFVDPGAMLSSRRFYRITSLCP